jgi:arylsulfatase A-like enzyme
MGMTAYLGPLRDRQAQLDYVNFYAHLHRVVDRHLGRLLAALGDADDPGSLRARTVIVRCADHGEMGLAHGGLRQKMFNAYEETINVPLVVSNPGLFGRPAETDALASLVDVLPTVTRLAGRGVPDDLRGRDLTPILAAAGAPDGELAGRAGVDLSPVLDHPDPAPSVQDAIHFTYDDHQAATAMQEAPGQPNRIRAIRTRDAKYAFYYDPRGRERPEYELYDLERDPLERLNLLGVRTGTSRTAGAAALHAELSEHLDEAMSECRTAPNGFGISGTPWRPQNPKN